MNIIERTLGVLLRVHPIVMDDAIMMADLSRFAPLPPEEQAKHDTTVYPSEILVDEIPPLIEELKALAEKKPEAWLIPHIQTFVGAEKVHFSRAEGCDKTDEELIDMLEGTVMWTVSLWEDEGQEVTDKYGVVHKPRPLVDI